jgi:hypothetical protein
MVFIEAPDPVKGQMLFDNMKHAAAGEGRSATSSGLPVTPFLCMPNALVQLRATDQRAHKKSILDQMDGRSYVFNSTRARLLQRSLGGSCNCQSDGDYQGSEEKGISACPE